MYFSFECYVYFTHTKLLLNKKLLFYRIQTIEKIVFTIERMIINQGTYCSPTEWSSCIQKECIWMFSLLLLVPNTDTHWSVFTQVDSHIHIASINAQLHINYTTSLKKTTYFTLSADKDQCQVKSFWNNAKGSEANVHIQAHFLYTV